LNPSPSANRGHSTNGNKFKGAAYFFAAALAAASLKIFFTVASLKVVWLLPEPMNPELATLGDLGGTIAIALALAFASCFAIATPKVSLL